MKKICVFILGMWCALTCFTSPVILTMIYLNVTGLIYQYELLEQQSKEQETPSKSI